jgi:hypothetical protein
MRLVKIVLASLVLAATLAPARVDAQASAPADLLQRIATSVQVFVDNLTNVVAEEEYRQQFRLAAGRRRLKSDFLLVGYPGQDKVFLTFRDVLEVDGRPIRDQQERLTKLFLEPFADAIRRAGEIQREGSRHSLERARLMDPLEVVAYHDNFKFTLGALEPSLGRDVRRIELQQILDPSTRQVPLRARAWVAESTGRVVKTELISGLGAAARLTTTTFGLDPNLRIDVPLEMRDSVPDLRRDEEFQGLARYGNFRRFQVRAEQEIDLPANPGAPR